MALTKVINDLADLNQSGSTNALKGCAGTTAQQPVSSSTIEYRIIAGGGGGGGGKENSWGGGGGGAGGYITGSTTVYHGTPTVLTIGAGGNGNNIREAPGFNGDDSGFNGIRAIGGGGGGAEGVSGTGQSAVDGGSGGGAGGSTSTGTPSYAGSGVSGQGNSGGSANTSIRSAAGGGGAGGAGANPSTALVGADGGVGVDIKTFISSTNATTAEIGEISGSDVYVAGGGGGASDYTATGTGGAGGNGGGGAGGTDGTDNGFGVSGTSNTGGGGGGGNSKPTPAYNYMGGTGGSGVAVLQYNNTEVTGYTLTGSLVGGVNTADKSSTVDFPAGAGCQALYQFENNTNDSSSNSYNPTSEANTAFPTSSPAPKFGTSSLYLDGSTTYVNGIPIGLMTKIRTAAQFSVSIWINPKTRPTGSGTNYLTGGKQIIKFIDDIYLAIFLDQELTLNYTIIPSLGVYIEYPQTQSVRRINLNEWSHICLTGSATNGLKFYINGQQEAYNPSWPGTFIYYNNSSYQTNGLTGNYPSLPGNPTMVLDGNLDNLRVYDNELTQSQVLELTNMNSTTKFVNSPTAGTDTLVFKGGTGNISFENTGPPGAEIGMVRANKDLSSANSTSTMEHFNSGGWKDFTNCTTSICNYPSNTTPIFLYQLDDLTDTCGNWNDATMVGGSTFTPGKFGDALTLTGAEYLTLSNTWTYDNNFSCSIWVYMNNLSMGSTAPGVLGFWGTGGYDWMIELDSSGTPKFNGVMYTSAGSQRAGTTTTLVAHTWYHIVFTASSTAGKNIYLNGVLEANNSNTNGTLNSYSDDNRIGSSRWGSTTNWEGKLDQLRLYNGVLTAGQVTELYNEVSCPNN